VPAVPTATGPEVAPALAPDTRSRILDIALELFSEHGFDGTTLQQIADRLGFSKAALYYHFRSKDDLLQALLAPAMTELEELLDAHESEPDTPGERRRFLEDYLDYLLGHRPLIAYMSSDLAILAHPVFATGSAERRARLERRLAGDGLGFTDQVRVAMAFRGIGGAIAQYPDADTPQFRAALLDAVRALMRAPRRRGGLPAPSANASSTA
jgi:AcrR family transcriptional regulator